MRQDSEEDKKRLANMKLSLTTYSTSLQGITEICKFCTKKANVQIHEIIEKSRLDCKTWNFDVACDVVCKAIYDYILSHLNIEQNDGGIVDVEVAYVKLVEDPEQRKDQQACINLCGYYHPTRNGPRIIGKSRAINEAEYHDAELFAKREDTPDIIVNISDNDEKRKDILGCSQYLGIPVFCATSENTSRMVGLLEIKCHGKSILSLDRAVIENMANHLFTPFAYLFLLLFKMDKALRAIPKSRRRAADGQNQRVSQHGKQNQNQSHISKQKVTKESEKTC